MEELLSPIPENEFLHCDDCVALYKECLDFPGVFKTIRANRVYRLLEHIGDWHQSRMGKHNKKPTEDHVVSTKLAALKVVADLKGEKPLDNPSPKVHNPLDILSRLSKPAEPTKKE